jgi:large subunit ribosomal protein L14
MIQKQTRLVVADNSGAKEVMVYHVVGSTGKRTASIGELVQGTVKVAIPGQEVKKKQKVTMVIVRQVKEFRRSDGSYISFGQNAGVIIKGIDDPEPVGTRVFGPVARELKRQYSAIVTLAPEVL